MHMHLTDMHIHTHLADVHMPLHIGRRIVEAFAIMGGKAEYMPLLQELLDEADIPAFLGGR